MDEKLIEQLKRDLVKSGLGSELKARKVFQDQDWSISGGAAYFDRDERKSREIDIVAHHNASVKRKDKVLIYNSFMIFAEVKRSEKPWIVFKEYPSKLLDSCAWNNMINAINLPCKPMYLTDALKRHSLLKINGWQGTGIHEAFKNPSQASKWHGAFLASIKAAADYYDEYGSKGSQTTADITKKPTEFTFHQPVVVLDGALVTAELSENSEIILNEIHSAAFEFEYRSAHYKESSYRVDVVTLHGLEDYLRIVKNRQASLNRALVTRAKLDV